MRPKPNLTPARSIIEDRAEIAYVAQSWAMWRDDGDWEQLRNAFAPGAKMATTWSQVSADEFIEASIALREQGILRGQHFPSPSVVVIKGDRALADTRQILYMQAKLGDVEVDVTCLGRAHDRFIRCPDGWRIHHRFPIYERDRIDPVIPGTKIEIDVDRLARFPLGYRFTGYVQEANGAKINLEMATVGSEAHNRLLKESRVWLDALAVGPASFNPTPAST